MLMAGLDGGMKSQFGVTGAATDFFYLGQSGCTTVEDVDDGRFNLPSHLHHTTNCCSDFREVSSAIDTVGLSSDEKAGVFQVH